MLFLQPIFFKKKKHLAARYSGPALWTGFQGFWSYALPWPGEEGEKEEEAEGAVRWEEGLGGNFLSLLWRDLKNILGTKLEF